MKLDFVIDVAFVIATVAFFKAQFGLKGWYAIGTALVTTLFLSFLPNLVALYPAAGPAIEKVIGIVKLFLAAPGLFDAAVDLGSKIKNSAVG